MNIKQFLKPDWRKIVITIFMMGISFPGYPLINYRGGGIPFDYLFSGGCTSPIGPDLHNIPSCAAFRFLPANFVLDIVILYLFSCFVIWIYDKFKKKPQ